MIEIMVVLSIIAAVAVFGVTRLKRTGPQLRSLTRKILSISKQIQYAARMNRQTYRLVLQLGEEKKHSFWVEKAEGTILLSSEEDDDDDKKKNGKARGGFEVDHSIIKRPQALPTAIFFEDVELGSRNTKITSGQAYIHFRPEGLVDEATIHLTDKKNIHWTLVIHPLTAHVQIVGKYISIKDIRKQ